MGRALTKNNEMRSWDGESNQRRITHALKTPSSKLSFRQLFLALRILQEFSAILDITPGYRVPYHFLELCVICTIVMGDKRRFTLL